MHPALQIQEILLRIFHHIPPGGSERSTALAALARTCHSFKEPALDVLWFSLPSLHPVVRCVPQACAIHVIGDIRCYLFQRLLSEEEWHSLLSYTRRTRNICSQWDLNGMLDENTLEMIYTPPVADTLFPNLQLYNWNGSTRIPPVHIGVPSLTALSFSAMLHDEEYLAQLRSFLENVTDFSPNINRFHIFMSNSKDLDGTICKFIRRLTKLQNLKCRGVGINGEMFSYLAEKPPLRDFTISLDLTIEFPSFSTSTFQTLECLVLDAVRSPLRALTKLLSCIRLPIVRTLDTKFTDGPSKESLRLYMTTIQNTCPSNSLFSLYIDGWLGPYMLQKSNHSLLLDDLQPLMVFSNLRHLQVNLPQWSIGLTDSDLLAMVFTWSHMETLQINNGWGWRTTSGITLRGLLRLLQTRTTLSDICIAIRTENHKDILNDLDATFPPPPRGLKINLLDSPIQSADVPSLLDVFWKLGWNTCHVVAWETWQMVIDEAVCRYSNLWRQLFDAMNRGKRGEDWLWELENEG